MFNAFIPELASLWIMDPVTAAKKSLDIHLAALEAFSEAMEQTNSLNRQAAARWVELLEELGKANDFRN